MAKKVRTSFKTNRNARARKTDWTQEYEEHGFAQEDTENSERVSGKGDLTRYRTVKGKIVENDDQGTGYSIHLDIDETVCRAGRVLSTHGLNSFVADEQTGDIYCCQVRRLLKTLSIDQRGAVVAGDRVLFRPAPQSDLKGGFIERIEPRRGLLCRTSRKRQHVIASNIDQVLMIASASQPRIKPNLIDRVILTAEKYQIQPVVCINKMDLVRPEDFQPLAGVYASMGYDVLFLSALTGTGIEQLRNTLRGRSTVVAGQSGVGKSSLLNAIDSSLNLRTNDVSEENSKGKHTTTAAQLIPLNFGGYVLDTPGIRSFQLWDVIPEEVAGFFRDLRPFANYCRFNDCTHTHESDCAVKNAVADGYLDARRYESYCEIFSDPLLEPDLE